MHEYDREGLFVIKILTSFQRYTTLSSRHNVDEQAFSMETALDNSRIDRHPPPNDIYEACGIVTRD